MRNEITVFSAKKKKTLKLGRKKKTALPQIRTPQQRHLTHVWIFIFKSIILKILFLLKPYQFYYLL